MTRYDRKKMIEGIILNGGEKCYKCGNDVTNSFTTVDDVMDLIETRRINNMLPKSVKNCVLVHKDCIRVVIEQHREKKRLEEQKVEEEILTPEEHIDLVYEILQKGLGWQNCYVCKKSLVVLTTYEEFAALHVYRARRNTPQYLVHPACVDKLEK